jgi:hypothetical protein
MENNKPNDKEAFALKAFEENHDCGYFRRLFYSLVGGRVNWDTAGHKRVTGFSHSQDLHKSFSSRCNLCGKKLTVADVGAWW